ncbi:asparagine synthase (glutamine-hydrolyzing) [Marinobacterium sp. D7]|uniref:asparagine synthase (glutamine-hydrolyzing) n=1 Tax=Marinobacterium ramblicola TaxID=2849041 RepID=UPI001C2D64DD|nr:asparagine synthase (glutamine-hydrolyzing) [Marinobacterium ramblicola]MBV1788887.1 asparagine synthase (glutamine-hydrolyzing) [Marinobacterium ramblicola]
MCGIAGVLNIDSRLRVDQLRDLTSAMAASMGHRGPDDHGVWVSDDGFCALAHRRLSVIDTSNAGHQPMLNGDHALVFNGEIYNFQTLGACATSQGRRFNGHSDTEVLLDGLGYEGHHFITRLDGMFAFGWYDITRSELTLARDPFGEKPLYYCMQNGLFAFASELQALTLLPGFDATISKANIATYLAFQHPPAPYTIYKNCSKLLPGTYLRVNRQGIGGACGYFQFLTDSTPSSLSLDEQTDQLEELMVDSLQRRLISDVPLGAFLSGGVDSSTAVALVTQKVGRNLKTFSVGFKGVPESEHLEARFMAERLGTEHYDEMIDPAEYGAYADLAAAMDEPNADSSCVPTYAISGLARRYVTVALTGDGGDEMFGGYQRYYDCIEAATDHANDILARRWHIGRDYTYRVLVYNDAQLAGLFGEVPSATADYFMQWRRRIDLDSRPVLNRLREMDVANYLPLVLAKVDRMSMQHSLECRTPYLSPELAQFAAGLAPDRLTQQGKAKFLLRNLAKRYLPAEWIDRKKKGFGVDPMNDIARTSVVERLAALLEEPECCLKDLLPPQALSDFVSGPLRQLGFYHAWSLLVLELWLRSHPWRAEA